MSANNTAAPPSALADALADLLLDVARRRSDSEGAAPDDEHADPTDQAEVGVAV